MYFFDCCFDFYTAEIFFDHGGSEKYMGVLFSTDIGWNHGLYFKSFNE